MRSCTLLGHQAVEVRGLVKLCDGSGENDVGVLVRHWFKSKMVSRYRWTVL